MLARALGQSGSPAVSGGPLTEREREVLAAVAQGEHSKEIARRLSITERTVKAHRASVYDELSVDSRASAVAVAHQRGLLR
jgi:NarL family two-component system response regulator YdfI